MKRTKIDIIFQFLIGLLLFTGCSKIEYLTDITETFKQANIEDKKVFVIVTSEECGKCARLLKSLDRSYKGKRILRENYVCCKLNKDEKEGKEFAMLMGTSFSPYSCFFKNNGELEAICIGDKKPDFENINTVELDDYSFRELFGYSIGFSEYKRQASLAVRSWLWQKDGAIGAKNLSRSYDLIKKSITIYPNCGNLSLAYQLSQKADPSQASFYKSKIQQIFTQRDYYLYGGFCFENDIQIDYQKLQHTSLKNEEYEIDKQAVRCGQLALHSKYRFEFTIENKKQEPLIIETVRKGCGCIDVQWTKAPILPGKIGFVKGTIKGEKKGMFQRQLFVYLKSKKFPLKCLVVSGDVK